MNHLPGFTGAAIDRADHLRLDTDRIARLSLSENARLLTLAGLDPMLDERGDLIWSSPAGADRELLFLGLDGEAPLFAPLVRAPIGQRAWNVFHILGQMKPRDAAIWGTARGLLEWHNRHNFCSQCGAGTRLFRAGWGRRCDACAAEHYPRVDPVVIMLAEHDGKILLGRQPLYPAGRYSALAGFVEPGESIEEAVARELYEEAGIVAGNVRYAASQPWPFPGSLMIGCLAESASAELKLDQDELEDAIWVDADAVARALAGEPDAAFLPPPPFAIAHSLLLHWLAGKGRAP